jgi:hypothetical protein
VLCGYTLPLADLRSPDAGESKQWPPAIDGKPVGTLGRESVHSQEEVAGTTQRNSDFSQLSQ